MICTKCGKQLEEDCLYCTECGAKVGCPPEVPTSNVSLTDNKIIDTVNDLINKVGDKKINFFLSIVTIVSLILIRILGIIIFTLIITATNAFLVYRDFKASSKLDTKMIVLSLAVLLVGIVICI